MFSSGCWVLHLTHPPVSSRVPLPTLGIFNVLCPAEVPCAWGPGSWTLRCMGHDEPCRFVPHQGMVVEGPRDRPHLTGEVGARDIPPILFPPRPVFLGPSFLHALCCHTQLALNVEFIYLLFLYSSLQFSLSLSENNGLVNFLSKTLKAWF